MVNCVEYLLAIQVFVSIRYGDTVIPLTHFPKLCAAVTVTETVKVLITTPGLAFLKTFTKSIQG